MDNHDEAINKVVTDYRNKIRILLILHYLSEDYNDPENPDFVKKFDSEVKLQKVDFLVRYPSYLCYELITRMKEDSFIDRGEVKSIVTDIFAKQEPQINLQEMRRFLFGAHDDLNDVIAFLHAYKFIHFSSKPRVDGKKYSTTYFLYKKALDKVSEGVGELSSLGWYKEKCELISRFFGDLKGSELKERQYKIDEYKNTPTGAFIEDIAQKTKDLFHTEFGEIL